MSEARNRKAATTVFVLAYRTPQNVIAHHVLALEYSFLRRVVHAGLAKVVRASAILARLYLREDKTPSESS